MKPQSNINTIELLKTIIDCSDERILVVSTSHKILLINKGMSELLPPIHGRAACVGDSFLEYVPPIKQRKYLEIFERANHETTLIFQETIIRNQEYFWMTVKALSIYQEDTLQAIVFYFKEEIESTIKNTFETIIANTQEGIIFLNPDLSIKHFNKASFSQSLKPFKTGTKITEYLRPDEKDQFLFIVNIALNGTCFEREVPINDSTGNTRWFWVKLFPVYNSNHDLLGVTILSQDVDHRKKTELALQQSEVKFRNVIENTPVAILTLNKNLTIEICNSRAEKLFGYQQSDLIGCDIRRFINHTYFEFASESILSENLTSSRFTTTYHKTGRPITVDVSINSYRVNTHRIIVLTVQDVTQILENEIKLNRQIEILKKIAWQQSHEVRKPLANIMGIIELLNGEKQNIPFDTYLEHLRQSTHELDAIVRNIVVQSHEIMRNQYL